MTVELPGECHACRAALDLAAATGWHWPAGNPANHSWNMMIPVFHDVFPSFLPYETSCYISFNRSFHLHHFARRFITISHRFPQRFTIIPSVPWIPHGFTDPTVACASDSLVAKCSARPSLKLSQAPSHQEVDLMSHHGHWSPEVMLTIVDKHSNHYHE